MIKENRQLVIDDLVEVHDCRKITNHFRGIYRIYPIYPKKTGGRQRVTDWTCKQQGLNQLCPKISPIIGSEGFHSFSQVLLATRVGKEIFVKIHGANTFTYLLVGGPQESADTHTHLLVVVNGRTLFTAAHHQQVWVGYMFTCYPIPYNATKKFNNVMKLAHSSLYVGVLKTPNFLHFSLPSFGRYQ